MARLVSPHRQGNQVTFFWQGETAPQVTGDWNNWDIENAPALAPIMPGLWAYTMTMPADAYMEYSFYVDGKHVRDPLNPDTTADGFGHRTSYFYMPEAARTPWITPQPGAPAGTVTRHHVDAGFLAMGKQRLVYLYQPPVTEPCPLLVVFDGVEYLRRVHLPTIVDNLIAQGRMQPVALALLAHGGKTRINEYACGEMTLDFIRRQVLPLAQAQLNLLDPETAPGSFGTLGSSMGGLMALYTGLRYPTIFGRVLSQSGAFNVSGHQTVIWPLISLQEPSPINIWLDVGRFERLHPTNLALYELLQTRGYTVSLREGNWSHNFPAWRNAVADGLMALYPPT